MIGTACRLGRASISARRIRASSTISDAVTPNSHPVSRTGRASCARRISVNVTAAVANTPPMIRLATWLTPVMLKSRIRASITSVFIRLASSVIAPPRPPAAGDRSMLKAFDSVSSLPSPEGTYRESPLVGCMAKFRFPARGQ